MPVSDLLEVRQCGAGPNGERLSRGLAVGFQKFESGHSSNLSVSLRNVNTKVLTQWVSYLLLNGRSMDVYEIRKNNLLLLEAETKSLRVIGDAMIRVVQRRGEDRAPDYQNVLSQHKGKKPIGAQTARLIEEAMKKPKGWMDVLQVDQAMEAKEAAQIAMNMSAEARESWLSLGRKLAAQSGTPGAALPFGDIPTGGPKKKPTAGTQ